MIRLGSIEINNFISVKHEVLPIGSLGLTLVRGKNGTGKSNIFKKALTYVLFGLVPEKLNVNDITPDTSTESTTVCIDLVNQSGDKIRIERYRNHKEYDNKLRLLVNNQDVSKTDNRETQKDINTILGTDFTTCVNSTIFSSGVPLFAESGAAGRASLLSNIKRLDIYEKALVKVKSKYSEVLDTFNKITTRISWLKESLVRDEKLLAEAETNSKLKEDNRQLRLQELESKLLSYDIASLQSVESIDYSIKGLEDSISTIDKSISDRLGEISNLQNSSIKIHTECKLIEEVLSNIETNDICPSCLQKISKEHAEHERARLNKTVSKLRKVLEADEAAMKNLWDLDKISKEELIMVKQELKKLRIRRDEIVRIFNEVKIIENKIGELKKEDYSISIEPIKENINESKQEIEALISSEKDYSLELKRLEFWKDGFGIRGIPNRIIEKSLSNIEESANKYLSGTGIKVILDSQKELKSKAVKEEIDISIIINGNTRTYNQLSSGEKKRVDIAFLFSLMDLSDNKFNILVLDEVFDISLDGEGCEMVMNLLLQKAKEVDSLIVISHKEELREQFDNVITVTKVNGRSELNGRF